MQVIIHLTPIKYLFVSLSLWQSVFEVSLPISQKTNLNIFKKKWLKYFEQYYLCIFRIFRNQINEMRFVDVIPYAFNMNVAKNIFNYQ